MVGETMSLSESSALSPFARGDGREKTVSARYPNTQSKTTLKLVAPKSSDLRLGGVAPTDDMAPGKYLVACETAWID
jgi:hypothetical protein